MLLLLLLTSVVWVIPRSGPTNMTVQSNCCKYRVCQASLTAWQIVCTCTHFAVGAYVVIGVLLMILVPVAALLYESLQLSADTGRMLLCLQTHGTLLCMQPGMLVLYWSHNDSDGVACAVNDYGIPGEHSIFSLSQSIPPVHVYTAALILFAQQLWKGTSWLIELLPRLL